MPTTMLLHDRRLLGFSPRGYDFSYMVDGNVALADALRMVRANTQTRRIASLHIFCHGRRAPEDHGQGITTTERLDGFGLELCREHLTLRNVASTQMWRGQIDQIVLFACAAARTAGSNAGTIGDGRRFCGELALWTQAEVIAARDVQEYARVEDTFWNRYVQGQPPLNFGAWEGPVYRFTPSHPEGTPHTPRAHDPFNAGVY